MRGVYNLSNKIEKHARKSIDIILYDGVILMYTKKNDKLKIKIADKEAITDGTKEEKDALKELIKELKIEEKLLEEKIDKLKVKKDKL